MARNSQLRLKPISYEQIEQYKELMRFSEEIKIVKFLLKLTKRHEKDHPPWSSRLYSRDAAMQLTKIIKYNPPYKQTERKKYHDDLIRCRKSYPFMIKSPGEMKNKHNKGSL